VEIKIIAGAIAEVKADAIMVGCFEGEKKPKGDAAFVDKALDGAIARLIAQGETKGKLNEITLVHSLGRLPAERAAVVGLGKRGELTPDKVRGAVAGACRRLRKSGAADIAAALLGAGINKISSETAAQAIAEGALLGLYQFRRHITKDAEHGDIKRLTMVAADKKQLSSLKKASSKGTALAEAANLARDMVNEPANYMTPADMAAEAASLAKEHGLDIEILERAQMKRLGMGALLGVAAGSQQLPRFIVLRYKGRGSGKIDIALVGKGITFDSGGISIKPSHKMEEMKGDMAGGAAVIAAMSAIARLKPKVNVIALIPATENLPSGSALKPGDVVAALGGKTIEIISTDAEGRLALADALGYANQLGAQAIVDVATLTGSVMVALGDVCTGAFGNDQGLVDKVIAAGTDAGELIWQLPMYDRYKEQNKSQVADIKNVGGRYAGSISAAWFLAEFVGDTRWVHLDIAGTSMTEKEQGYLVKGATGVAVRTLINLVLSLAK